MNESEQSLKIKEDDGGISKNEPEAEVNDILIS
jgi:hypothetical protein